MWPVTIAVVVATGLLLVSLRMLRDRVTDAQEDIVGLLRVIRDQLDEANPQTTAGKKDRAAQRLMDGVK